jgi:hypothetical protein
MGVLTYLQMTNRVLKRISQSVITDVTAATGQALIITELINEAQTELWSETTNWYTLYATRTFATVANTAEYAQASDWGRTIDMMDTTTNRILTEDVIRAFDENDPDADYTGTPTHFAVQGSNYRLHPIPSGVLTIRERYWKFPTVLAANANTSDLPSFCDNFLIEWSRMMILEYLQKYDQADRVRLHIYGVRGTGDKGLINRIKLANNKILDRMDIFQSNKYDSERGIHAPKFPSTYGVYYR